MAILEPTTLETADYGTAGWNAIYSSNFQKLNQFLTIMELMWNNLSSADTNKMLIYDHATEKWKRKTLQGTTNEITITHGTDTVTLSAGEDLMKKTTYDTDNDGVVDRAETADKLTTARQISLTGYVTGSTTFDGSQNVSITSSLVMSKSYYVDAVNGSDNNDGSSSAPFQTIKKAVDSLPIGAWGNVYVKVNQTHQITADINTTGKNVLIQGWDPSGQMTINQIRDATILENVAYVDTDGYQKTYKFCFSYPAGTINFTHLTIKTANRVSETAEWHNFMKGIVGVNMRGGMVGAFSNCKIELGDSLLVCCSSTQVRNMIAISTSSNLILRRSGAVDSPILFSFDTSHLIASLYSYSMFNWTSLGISGETDKEKLAQLMQGIVRDSTTGLPINVLCNLAM